MIAPALGGMTVLVSPTLPLAPSTGEWARRLVRHGMAEVLEWLGEDVGPEPDALTHVVLGADPTYFGPRVEVGHQVAFVSSEMYERLKQRVAA